MNSRIRTQQPGFRRPRPLVRLGTLAAALLLASCASPPRTPEGAVAARARLTQLQGNIELASRAAIEIRDADLAVSAAEQPLKDQVLSRHLVLIAGQKVEIADAWAQSRLYEDQRTALAAESEAARLASRTREADLARSQTRAARNEASTARSATLVAQGQTAAARADANEARDDTALAQDQAAVARNQTTLARLDTEAARAETVELQRQLEELNALATDRGLVVTLGDVLFETGKAELRGGTADNLDKLAAFLNRYETRTVQIEGHTDSVGTASSNSVLSEHRANSVQTYLAGQGVRNSRMSAAGKGEHSPIASNDSNTGRQLNRRVEVIISTE